MRVLPAPEVSDHVTIETKVRLWEKGLGDIFSLITLKSYLIFIFLLSIFHRRESNFFLFLSIIYVAPTSCGCTQTHTHTIVYMSFNRGNLN